MAYVLLRKTRFGKYTDPKLVFHKGPFPVSFSFIFVFSVQLIVNKILLMTVFEVQISGVKSDLSAN